MCIRDRNRIEEIRNERDWLSSEEMREMVESARKVQEERYEMTPYRYNGDLDEEGIRRYCSLDDECQRLLLNAYEKYDLTMRGYQKILKISRTIADMDRSESIKCEHIAEALMYRALPNTEES